MNTDLANDTEWGRSRFEHCYTAVARYSQRLLRGLAFELRTWSDEAYRTNIFHTEAWPPTMCSGQLVPLPPGEPNCSVRDFDVLGQPGIFGPGFASVCPAVGCQWNQARARMERRMHAPSAAH